MVTTVNSDADARYRASPGMGYDGVVRISGGGHFGTGALLFDGRAVLTAAHLVAGASASLSVAFQTVSGTQTYAVSQSLVNPNYLVSGSSNGDLALVWLSQAPTLAANRYDIYRDTNEIGQNFTLVGYGQLGTGAMGATNSNSGALRLQAQNTFDVDAATLKSALGSSMAWSPTLGTQLAADFDNGTSAQDAFGRLVGLHDVGLGLNEGLVAQGDSGGPAFLAGKVAGVASYTSSLSQGETKPDIDTQPNSSFGEMAAWQRMSSFQQWIDQSMRAHYANAPTRPDDVKKQVTEGHTGTSYAYFFVQISGTRTPTSPLISVDYATRDGTATAGSDYVATAGRVNLYPGESHAVVPVEIVGDTVPEANETFYLDVFSPVGGTLGLDVVKLTAVRTILDDDLPMI